MKTNGQPLNFMIVGLLSCRFTSIKDDVPPTAPRCPAVFGHKCGLGGYGVLLRAIRTGFGVIRTSNIGYFSVHGTGLCQWGRCSVPIEQNDYTIGGAHKMGRHIMTYDRLSSSHVHAHEAADLIIQAELPVYTPLSLGVSHSTLSQAVGLSTIDLSYCACEIAFA
eukprot:scaffold14104_cov79-Skeletonema_marinoi.AAC.1